MSGPGSSCAKRGAAAQSSSHCLGGLEETPSYAAGAGAFCAELLCCLGHFITLLSFPSGLLSTLIGQTPGTEPPGAGPPACQSPISGTERFLRGDATHMCHHQTTSKLVTVPPLPEICN